MLFKTNPQNKILFNLSITNAISQLLNSINITFNCLRKNKYVKQLIAYQKSIRYQNKSKWDPVTYPFLAEKV